LKRRPSYALCCTAAALQIGCGATVIPPVSPAEPTTVYLCDYGVHSSLLLPVNGHGRYVEYLYGDWNWAALNHTAWYDAIGAIFISQQATLGRRFINVPIGQDRPSPYPPPKTEVGLVINGQGCQTVIAALDRRWKAHESTATVPVPADGYYSYVRDDHAYSWLHDCNHHTADCLRQMGCEVHGSAMLSDFSVAK
jgi:hypothetical protein